MAAAKPKTRELASMEMAAWQAHIMLQAAIRVMMQSAPTCINLLPSAANCSWTNL